MSLTIKDLQAIQSSYPDYPMELVKGEIIIMSPSGYQSDEIAAAFTAQLYHWVRSRGLGRVTASSAGFTLPNGECRSPDVSFVRSNRLPRSPRHFAPLAPDLMVEVKSPTDNISKTREKIQAFLEVGTTVGILINPDDRTVEVYYQDGRQETLTNGEILTLPELLPEWECPLTELWPLEFPE